MVRDRDEPATFHRRQKNLLRTLPLGDAENYWKQNPTMGWRRGKLKPFYLCCIRFHCFELCWHKRDIFLAFIIQYLLFFSWIKPIRERKVYVCILKPVTLLWNLNIRDRFKPICLIAETDLGPSHRHIEHRQELIWKIKINWQRSLKLNDVQGIWGG